MISRVSGCRSWTFANALTSRAWFFSGESRPTVTNVVVSRETSCPIRARLRASWMISRAVKCSSSVDIVEAMLPVSMVAVPCGPEPVCWETSCPCALARASALLSPAMCRTRAPSMVLAACVNCSGRA